MLVIVDYNAGNVRSVQRACEHVGMDAIITSDPDVVAAADKLIFPGVGSAISAVDTLKERGLDKSIVSFFNSGKPMLGICLGLQIALDFTEEGKKDCLGIVPGACEKFDFLDRTYKVPHIGWNEVNITRAHPMLADIDSGDEFYFVHSYYAVPEEQSYSFGTTQYGDTTFCSIIGRDNFFATQFHLEKSGKLGLRLLASFANWDGSTC